MSFQPDEDQQELIALMRDILQQRADSTATRRAIESAEGFDTGLWRLLCDEIGVAGMAIPEEYGGAGYSLRESQLVLEEIGRSLAPSPYLGAVAIAAQAILASRDQAAAARLLPGIAEGSSSAALAWADPTGGFSPDRVAVKATHEGEEWLLDGSVSHVLDGDIADVILVIAQSADGPCLFEVIDAAAVERVRTLSMDQTLRLSSLRFTAVAARRLGDGGRDVVEEVRAHALTAISAVQAGTASRALDMTVEYAKQRVQFGRQIGSFQAVKHRLADMHVRVETALTSSRAASAALGSAAADRLQLASIAKVTCSESLQHVAAETIQLHGGIAITWEHDAHLVLKRAHALGQLFGTARELRENAESWALAQL